MAARRAGGRTAVTVPMGFFVGLLILAAVGVVSYRNTLHQDASSSLVEHTYRVREQLNALRTAMSDAETGQRGYIITGSETYLEPYRTAVWDARRGLATLRRLTADNRRQQRHLDALERLVRRKIALIERAVRTQRAQGGAAAERLVRTRRGQKVMDEIRRLLSAMDAEEERLLRSRESEAHESARQTRLVIVLGGVLAVLFAACALLVIERDSRARHRYEQRLWEANERLEELATKDGLTGLNNHRTLQERLAQEWERAERHGSPLSFLLLDVDRFKDYNDTFGHPAGDEVLRTVSAVLTATVREADILARYGGEEFAVILPDNGHDGAARAAERLCRAIESASCPGRGVTASIGVATRSGATGCTADLVTAADRALYRAKRQGRNRVAHDQEFVLLAAAEPAVEREAAA